MVRQTQNGTGMPTFRQVIQPTSETKDAQSGSTSAATFHQARDDDEEMDPYTLPDPVEITTQQNATPTYEKLPLRDPHLPIVCSENQLEMGSSNTGTIKHPGARSHLTGISMYS